MPFSLVFYSFQVYSKVTLVLSWGNKSSPISKVGYVRKQMSKHTGNLSRLVLFLILPMRLRTAGSPVFPAVPTLAPAVLQGQGGRGLLSLWRGLGGGWGDPMRVSACDVWAAGCPASSSPGQRQKLPTVTPGGLSGSRAAGCFCPRLRAR